MSGWIVIGIGLVAVLVATVLLSYLVEVLRSARAAPARLDWAPEATVELVNVNGIRVRCLAVGRGRPLLLLHTLRTQLDMFQKVIPRLSAHFRVYAMDYLGHGYSDIPEADYSPEFFLRSVAGLLERLEIDDVTVAGESIGGSLALLLAARRNPRVSRVIAVNPYDYDGGRGILRSSAVSKVIFGLSGVPIVGGTVMRLRAYPVVKKIFEGGVSRKDSLPPALLREMYEVGNRRGHYRAFMSLMRRKADWERTRAEYSGIAIPVLLIYGSDDWSHPEEREADLREIPGAQMRIVAGAGHFLSLDAPDALVDAILDFSGPAAPP